MSSLDRLINLAKKTGDRLIVHNPIDNQDVVIMDLDSYEGMLFGRRGIRPQSSTELLEEINRDIAKWRADRQVEEEWEQAGRLEEEYWGEEGIPFGPDLDHEPNHWSSAGEILSNRYRDVYSSLIDHDDLDFEDQDMNEDDWDLGEDTKFDESFDDDSYEVPVDDIPFGFDDEDELGDEEEEGVEELQYLEPASEVSGSVSQPQTGVHFSANGKPTPVAYVDHQEDVQPEVPLKKDEEEGDGPVFLEEPV